MIILKLALVGFLEIPVNNVSFGQAIDLISTQLDEIIIAENRIQLSY